MLRNASKKYSETAWGKDKFFLSNYWVLPLCSPLRSRRGGWGGRHEPLLFAVKMRNLQMVETVSEKAKPEVDSGCDQGQVRVQKIYKGQIHIKYDACNIYI